jgi:hypothetical protein
MNRLNSIVSIALLSSGILLSGCSKSEVNVQVADEHSSSALKAAGGGNFALDLNGAGDYVRVPDNPSLDLSGRFTVAAWIYIEEYTEWASIVTKGETVNNFTIHQSGPLGGSEPGHLRFTGGLVDLPVFLESETQIPLNEWHFVAITWDGAMLRFYLDGNPDGSGSLVGTLDTNDEPLFIGADFPGSGEFWNGKIDEVRIWNEALSPAHVRASMHGSASPLSRALVGSWNLNEGSGTTAADRSRFSNHGSLIGSPSWVRR